MSHTDMVKCCHCHLLGPEQDYIFAVGTEGPNTQTQGHTDRQRHFKTKKVIYHTIFAGKLKQYFTKFTTVARQNLSVFPLFSYEPNYSTTLDSIDT